jgi:hypothetical protein
LRLMEYVKCCAGAAQAVVSRGMIAAALLVFALPCANAAEPAPLTLELNKLEPNGAGCRIYMLIENRSEIAYQSFKLDLVLFQPNGIIGKRVALELAPAPADKRSLKVFDVEKNACESIGSVLINEVMACSTAAGPAENCLARLTLKSLASVQLMK